MKEHCLIPHIFPIMKFWRYLFIVMKLKIVFCPILIIALLMGTCRPARADNQGLKHLLEIFERRALISPEEAKTIRAAMAEDERRLLEKENELEAKRKALLEWEKELGKKEQALRTKTDSFPASEERVVSRGSGEEGKTGNQNLAGPQPALVEERGSPSDIPLKATYQDGFCLSSIGKDLFSLCLGGLLQADYRHFEYDGKDPQKNKFDLRRVRLQVHGTVSRHLSYKFEYEFEGAGSRRLLDAYADVHILPFASLRIGQFKEPFGLEFCTLDKDGFFVERSMGFYLTPGRDVGCMVHASLFNDRVTYGIGVFNGDGPDDATGGDVDDPQWAGRVVLAPFKNRSMPLFDTFQVGGSYSYAKIDRNNVKIAVKTSGLTTFFDVASGAKFNIIREVETLSRSGLEFAWTCGPFALQSEYFHVRFRDIATSTDRFDTVLEDYYLSCLWMLTGERPVIREGVFQSIEPKKSIWEGGWGGIGLAFRYDYFRADGDVYDNLVYAGNSVRRAKAYSIAIKWYLDQFTVLALDATRTEFDQPLLVGRDPIKGTAMLSDREDVVTARFQLGF